jgi:Fic family protein
MTNGPVHYHQGEFPPASLRWPELISLIGPANAALARYEGVLHAVPNAAVLLSPLTTREAVLSSRIEGTQATMGEVLEYEAGADAGRVGPEKQEDILEILNYRTALRRAMELLGELPISGRLIREMHATLMQGVRGRDKAPGEYRRVQNLIGPPGCDESNAGFVPVGEDKLEAGMSEWEKYLHSTPQDQLVQLAIAHAEFESLHPFMDGNGRVGRLLIPLFLYERKLLSEPMFYMSAYLEAQRAEYYERLRAVSRDGDWTGWVRFFLKAVIEQARSNEVKARQILELYANLKDRVVDLTHSQYAIRALDFLFARPIFRANQFVQDQDVPAPSAQRILRLFREEGLVATLEQARGRRPGRFVFGDLINIVEGEELF